MDLFIQALAGTLSDDAAVREPAENALTEWEKAPGTLQLALQCAANNPQHPHPGLRLSAAVYAKNVVARQWSPVRGTISAADKAQAKQMLLQMFAEPQRPVATQISLMAGKIVRMDGLEGWEELLPTIGAKAQSADRSEATTALVMLRIVLVELASSVVKRPGLFGGVAKHVFPYLREQWELGMGALLAHETPAAQRDVVSERVSLLSKSLRLILRYGKLPYDNFQIAHFLQRAYEHMVVLMPMAAGTTALEKAMVGIVKLALCAQEGAPIDFSRHGLLTPFLTTCARYVAEYDPAGAVVEKFLVRAMLFLKEVARCSAYRNEKDASVNEELTCGFFSAQTLAGLCQALILRHFVLNQDDLAFLVDDPEAFYLESLHDSHMDRPRPCAEVLLLTLVCIFRDTLAPVVVQMVQQSLAADAASAELVKDACYRAFGLCAYDIYDYVDFPAFFDGSLVADARSPSAVTRSRAAWVVGSWVTKIRRPMRPRVYELLVNMMAQDPNLAVRLSAALAIKDLVEDPDFYGEDFEPFIPAAFPAWITVIGQLEEIEAKQHILSTMSMALQQLRFRAAPYVSAIVELLPPLWIDPRCEEQPMLQTTVITILTNVVEILGASSPSLYPVAFPIVAVCTNISRPESVVQCDDAVDLLLTIVDNAPESTKEILSSFRCILGLLERDYDNLMVGLQILDGLLLLGGAEFVEMYRGELPQLFDDLISYLREESRIVVAASLILILEISPDRGPVLFKDLLAKIAKLLVDPSAECSDLLAANFFVAFARILFSNPSFFSDMFAAAGPALLVPFVDRWLQVSDNIMDLDHRKLSALALCSMIPTPTPELLSLVPQLLGVVADVLHDPVENPPDPSGRTPTAVLHDDWKGMYHTTAFRRARATMGDPATRASLQQVCLAKLQEMAAINGQDVVQSLVWSRTDPQIVAMIQNPAPVPLGAPQGPVVGE